MNKDTAILMLSIGIALLLLYVHYVKTHPKRVLINAVADDTPLPGSLPTERFLYPS